MEFDDSHCSAESDAGAGGGGGRVYAWGMDQNYISTGL